jgi:type VI secretion system secreted protein VgrG
MTVTDTSLTIVNALTSQFSSETRLYALALHDHSQQTNIANANQTNTTDQAPLGVGGLLVEAFTAVESLHGISTHDLIVLSTSANINLASLINQTASLQVSLADASRTTYTGIIDHIDLLGSEGGLARYHVRLVSWLWLLSQHRISRVWQDQSVMQIVDSIFAAYPNHATWRWSDDVMPFMADTRPRSYCVQYRETDFDFMRRLLTEEGLSWRIEEASADATVGNTAPMASTPQNSAPSVSAPSLHRVVLFADTSQLSATPEDATSAHALGGRGIRFHGARSREVQDSIQALAAKRVLNVAVTTVLSHDYKAKQSIAASVLTHHQYGGEHAPVLESYDPTGIYSYANSAEANRYAKLQQEAHEARNKQWLARSTVRTLRPGTRFTLTQGPLSTEDALSQDRLTAVPHAEVKSAGKTADPEYIVLKVNSLGINNLPKPAQESLAELFGDVPSLLHDCIAQLNSSTSNSPFNIQHEQNHPVPNTHAGTNIILSPDITLATRLGYANAFEAIRADIPWRPVLFNGSAKPTAPGSQTAIVIGASGGTVANGNPSNSTTSGADEIYCDRLGRIRIRFHWQGLSNAANLGQTDDSTATCWVRVAQRSAGAGMGSQFLPRIGQEVEVQFIEGDIDRPIVLGALYNGQGEGGVTPTPAGKTAPINLSVFEAATDHAISAQGNLANGNSPVWHGASGNSGGHNNAAAISGIRSKEFGGAGYNQLAFDDTDRQGRIQLSTTQAATALNLGHLIHTADNYRGSFRGLGAELRTNAYGALRAGAGYLISSYAVRYTLQQRDAAGDNTAGMAHLSQAVQLAKSFNQAAKVHQTVQYACHIGSVKAGSSAIDNETKQQAPLKALHTAASGMVSHASLNQAQQHAADKHTTPTASTLPHSTDAIISVSAKAGLGVTAAKHLQLANQETTTLMSGQDSQFITGNQFRLHTGQAIGMLAGAVQAGANNTGLQLIAAQDNIHLQAQSDAISIQAKDQINIMSSHAHIDWAAAKSISLSTADGANITIDGGNITVQCPGKVMIHAGKKSFTGPERLSYPLPQMPRSICVECLKKALKSGAPFVNR